MEQIESLFNNHREYHRLLTDYQTQANVVETARYELTTAFASFLHTASATNLGNLSRSMLTYQKAKNNLSSISYLIHTKEKTL